MTKTIELVALKTQNFLAVIKSEFCFGCAQITKTLLVLTQSAGIVKVLS